METTVSIEKEQKAELDNKKQRNIWKLVAIVSIILCLMLIVGLIVVLVTGSNKSTNGEESVIFGNFSTICTDEQIRGVQAINSAALASNLEDTSIRDSYDTFDQDNDGEWSPTEFRAYHDCTLNHSALFDNMDYNNDDIVSFREMVSHFMNIKGIVKELYVNTTGPALNDLYNFSMDEPDQSWHERVADMFFTQFDKTNEGYIKRWKFVNGLRFISFEQYDTDSNGGISYTEFKNRDLTEANAAKISNLNLFDDDNNFAFKKSDLFSTYGADDILFLKHEICPSGSNNDLSNYHPALIQGSRRRLSILGCVGGVLGTAATAIGTGAACSVGEVGTAGADTAVCVAGVIGTTGAATGTSDACGASSCFGSGSNELFIKRYGNISKILLSQLRIGDFAQSKNENNEIIWSKVWFINEHPGTHEMIKLLYSYDNGNKFGNLTLTKDHLLYRNDFELLRADNILMGDVIKLIDYSNTYSNKTFINGEIIDISYNIYDYARSPITIHGDIVISSVLSSSYTKSISTAANLHKAAHFFRHLSEINTEFGALVTNIFYNYVYKSFKAMSVEGLCQYYVFAPVVTSTCLFVFIFPLYIKLK